MDYLLDTYVDEESDFQQTIWAEAMACLIRITNACQVFHVKFNKYFYKTHPSLFVFLSILKEFP